MENINEGNINKEDIDIMNRFRSQNQDILTKRKRNFIDFECIINSNIDITVPTHLYQSVILTENKEYA